MSGAPVTVSVVIPTRNRASLLADCLESLTSQRSATPFEIVVVDNASTDRTPEFAAEAAARDPRVRVVREARLGRARALDGLGRSGDARRAWKEFLDRHPGSINADRARARLTALGAGGW